MTTVLLVHGGLWDEPMDARRFWREPGIVTRLTRRGFTVLAPDRLRRPPSWQAEADYLAPAIARPPVTILAGSNGCSVAARLALTAPAHVARMILAWPATAGDPAIDAPTRAGLAELGAAAEVIGALLAGQTLRGVTDAELAALTMPVGVLPADPSGPFHQRRTADALLRLLPQAERLTGFPEPPRPQFAPRLDGFIDAVAAFIARRPPP